MDYICIMLYIFDMYMYRYMNWFLISFIYNLEMFKVLKIKLGKVRIEKVIYLNSRKVVYLVG